MTDNNHAIANARAWADDIRAAMIALDALRNGDGEPVDYDGESFDDESALSDRLQEKPLSVQVRGGWHNPGDSDGFDAKPEEFMILLSTGGPALRIVGDLDGYGQPSSPRLQWQDWGTPWNDHATDYAEDQAIAEFCQLFYFGE